MDAIEGAPPLERMYCMACVPTCITNELMSDMLYLVPASLLL